jgi:uncharacterized protein involved in type VI secretion and phage assembly
MTPVDEHVKAVSHAAPSLQLHGVMTGIVSDIVDPDGQGRVKVKLPWLAEDVEVWARIAMLAAGPNKGTWFIPETDDEVLVAFENGDPRRPYVLGVLWNGVDSPPESMDGAGNNYKKVVCSKNAVKITLDDTDGQEQLILETPGGQKLTLHDGPGSVTIEDSNGNSVKLEAAGITVTASAKVTVNASTAEISASTLTVNAGMSKFSGVVQADTVITNAVVSASYTPGAGNIW